MIDKCHWINYFHSTLQTVRDIKHGPYLPDMDQCLLFRWLVFVRPFYSTLAMRER